MELARGELLCVLSDDLLLDEGYFAPLIRHFERAEVFSVAPLILTASGREADYPPAIPTARRGRVKLRRVRDLAQLRAPVGARPATLYASGGMTMFRRDRFVALGGFSRLYDPGYEEDVDLGWRAWSRGWGSFFEPASVVHHDHQQGAYSTQYRQLTRRTFCHRNRALLNLVNFDQPVAVQLLWLTFRSGWQVLREFWRPRARVVAAAYVQALRRLPAALRERRRERAARRHDNAWVFAAVAASWPPRLEGASVPADEPR